MVISHVTPLKMVISHLRFLLPLLALLSSMAASSTGSSSSIYEIPMGLLPSGVTNFSLDNSGKFAVYLDRACNTKFENELHYEKNVSGSIRYGRIDGLSGISAQDLFLWFPVIEIRVDVPSSGLIYFDVGASPSSSRSPLSRLLGTVWLLRIRVVWMGKMQQSRFCPGISDTSLIWIIL